MISDLYWDAYVDKFNLSLGDLLDVRLWSEKTEDNFMIVMYVGPAIGYDHAFMLPTGRIIGSKRATFINFVQRIEDCL